MKHTPVLLLSAFFALGSSRAAVLTVTSSADDGDGTLRALCAAASQGDTIQIPAGMTITLDSAIRTIDKATYFLGDPDNRPVITTSGSGYRAIEFARSAAPYEFRDLVFRNIDAGSSLTGGGLYLSDYTPQGVIISNCLFDACSAKQGAGVHLNRLDGPAFLIDCEFRDCSTTDGYACLLNGKGTFERCLFTGNTTVNNAPGAICNGGWWFVTDCVFTNNVGKSGGAILMPNTPSNRFTRCTFIDNTATDSGGAVWGRNPYIMHDCVIRRNYAKTGGAIFRYNGRIELYGCIFEENATAGGDNWQGGAAIFNRADTGGAVISNCVFRSNRNVESNGTTGALHGYGSDTLTLVDTLFEGNEAKSGAGAMKITGPATIQRCTFRDNLCSNGIGCVQIDITDYSYAYPDLMESRPVLIENCTFVSNTTVTGQALFWTQNNDATVDGTKVQNVAQLTLRHCTVVDNVVGGGYGAVTVNRNPATSRVDIEACVFHNNLDNKQAPKDFYGPLRKVTGTVADQAASGITIQDTAGSGNNWFGGSLGNLKFADALAANGSTILLPDGSILPTLAVESSSPLRDKVAVTTALDARGLPRGSASGFATIGAYEYIPFIPTLFLVR